MEPEPSAPALKGKITDEERQALSAKLDSELEDFMNGLEKRRYTEGWPEDRWQEEMEKHPFFMTSVPEDGEEMSPLIQGLQQLKYDETDNTPSELAVAYKDDGNFNFKCKKYRFAIIGYTEGLMKKCGDPAIESQLYNNRAAAHFNLGNVRSSISDCKAALKLCPEYSKARLRLAQCYQKLSKFQDCVDACDELLALEDNSKAKDLRSQAVLAKRYQDRDERKRERSERQKQVEEERLKEAFKERGVQMVGVQDDVYPGAVQTQVRLADDGRLVWPVLFLYPQVASSDLVQEFHEDSTFGEQLKVMFETCPDWDVEREWRPDGLSVYYECKDKAKLYPVTRDMTLGQVLTKKDVIVRNGSPCFIVVVKGSSSEERLIASYR